jgi:hypothetical protein
MGSEPAMARVAVRCVYVCAFLALAVVYYEFLGAAPTPSEKPETIAWWRPMGLALQLDSAWLAPLQKIAASVEQARHEGSWEPRGAIPLALTALPPLLLIALGFALFRSAVSRVLVLGLGLTLCAFGYYGWLDPATWQDYGWRWPAVLLSTSLCLSVFVLSPALVAALRSRAAALQVIAAAVFALSIYFLSIEITGTNPTLQWNISPWPTLTLYGFLLLGLLLGVVYLATGAGLLVGEFAVGARRAFLAAALAAGVAFALRGVAFATAGPLQIAVLVVPAALLAGWAARRDVPRVPAISFGVAGLALVASIKAGQWQGEYFQAFSRDEIATNVIAALEKYREERGSYPDELRNLVPRFLAAVPFPRVGWFDSDDEQLVYTFLGDSFLLEFPSVLWVQCAYSPSYRETIDAGDDVAASAEAATSVSGSAASEQQVLEAAWTCESKPPRLW